ncbi:MAG: inositol monophosphatase family protein [Prevotella sp.]
MITIEQLTGIVRDASSLMVTDGFQIEQKGGCENIVTSSDVAVQNFLCERLSELMPDSGFLCEEKDIYDTRHEYTWIIDPIDGTANYSRGIDQCAICVGLKHDEDMQMGVVYIPRTGELFHAEKDKGAYLNSNRIHVSSRSFNNAVLCTALPVYYKEYAEVCSKIILDAFCKCNDIRRFGACAPELCYLAMGRCELYFEYLLSPWDYAAASLIVKEAGGIISSMDGSGLCLTKPTGVIAANNTNNYQKLLDIVKNK